MNVRISAIIDNAFVCTTACSGKQQRNIKVMHYWPFAMGINQCGYGRLVSNTTHTRDNSYPRQPVPRTTRTKDNLYPGQLGPKTTRTQNDSYPGQLVPKTILTQSNSYPGQHVPYRLAITLQASSMYIQELYQDGVGRVKIANSVFEQYFPELTQHLTPAVPPKHVYFLCVLHNGIYLFEFFRLSNQRAWINRQQ